MSKFLYLLYQLSFYTYQIYLVLFSLLIKDTFSFLTLISSLTQTYLSLNEFSLFFSLLSPILHTHPRLYQYLPFNHCNLVTLSPNFHFTLVIYIPYYIAKSIYLVSLQGNNYIKPNCAPIMAWHDGKQASLSD